MKRSKKSIIIGFIMVVFIVGCLTSCSDEDSSGAIYNKTYITGYLMPESVTTDNSESGIILTINGNVFTNGDIFNELSKLYNDTSYNRYSTLPPRIAIGETIYKIRIETIDYFDISHPSGSDISDLIECQYISYYDYVQSGYQDEHKNIEDYKDAMEYYHINGAKLFKEKLVDIDYTNMNLCTPGIILKFNEFPENQGKYQFKLVFVTQHNEFETTFSCDF